MQNFVDMMSGDVFFLKKSKVTLTNNYRAFFKPHIKER